MALLIEHGTFQPTATTGTVNLTTFGGETPKALMLGFYGADSGCSWGMCDATITQYCCAIRNRHNRTSTAVSSNLKSGIIGAYVSHSSDTLVNHISITSFGADSFSWSVPSGSANPLDYWALGGSDLTCKLHTWVNNLSAPGTLAINGVGFQGNSAITLFQDMTAPGFSFDSKIGIFLWGPGPTNGGTASFAIGRNAEQTSFEKHTFDDNLPVHTSDRLGALADSANALRWTSDGFELDYTAVGGTNPLGVSLIMNTPSAKVSKFIAPSSAGTVVDDLGFPGKGSFLSTCDATADSVLGVQHDRMTNGFFDGTSHAGISFSALDNSGTSVTDALPHANGIEHWDAASRSVVANASAAYNGNNLELTYATSGNLAYRVMALTLGESSGPPTLSGTITAEFDSTGDLDVSPVLSGSITGELDTAGDLDVSPVLAGTIAAELDTTGDFDVSPVLAGTITSELDTAGAFDVSAVLAGTITGELDTAGDFDVPISGLSGSITAQLDTAGDLDVSPILAGTIAAELDTAGNLTVTVPGELSGSITAYLNTQGNLDVSAPPQLSGAITAQLDTAGDFSVQSFLAGTIAAEFDTTGTINVGTFTPNPNRVCTTAAEDRSVRTVNDRTCVSREI